MSNKYMEEAIKEAKIAYAEDEIPVGAVLVYQDKIISKAHNSREKENKISAHAEIQAIEKAAKKLGTWKLEECELYITLEPCLMCYSAIKQSRIKKVYIGQRGNIQKKYTYQNFLEEDKDFNYDLLGGDSLKLLKDFFKDKRK